MLYLAVMFFAFLGEDHRRRTQGYDRMNAQAATRKSTPALSV
jgi:hypothetical protein